MTEAGNLSGAGRDGARVRAGKARRRLIVNVIIALVILAGILIYWRVARSGSALPQGLITARVERMDIIQTVSATGSVTAQTGAMVKIGSQITGRIKQLHADVGSKVEAGQIIAELAVPDLEAQVRQVEAAVAVNRANLAQQRAGVPLQDQQTRADIEKGEAGVALARTNLQQVEQSTNLEVATAEAGVSQARANANNSAANLERVRQLFDQGFLAAADLDNAKAQAEVNSAQLASAEKNLGLVQAKVAADLNSARAQLRQAEATLAAARAGVANPAIKRQQVAAAANAVRQSEASLAVSRAQLDKAFIRTPISGTVLQLSQQQGETIAAGLSAPTLIIVADLDRLQVDAFVDETDIGRVELGQPAQVIVDSYPNHPFQGRVAKIASGATMQQNVVTYDVTVALDNPEHMLKPDMTTTTNITVARRSNVLAVPVDAIKLTVGGSTVTVMNRDRQGRAVFGVVKVSTGASDGENTEIINGLKEGQVVVLSGQVPGMEAQSSGPRFRSPLGFGGRGGGQGGRR